jgi:hypothetical protein
MDWLAHLIDYGVIALLAALSVIVVAIALERWSFYRRFLRRAKVLTIEWEMRRRRLGTEDRGAASPPPAADARDREDKT